MVVEPKRQATGAASTASDVARPPARKQPTAAARKAAQRPASQVNPPAPTPAEDVTANAEPIVAPAGETTQTETLAATATETVAAVESTADSLAPASTGIKPTPASTGDAPVNSSQDAPNDGPTTQQLRVRLGKRRARVSDADLARLQSLRDEVGRLERDLVEPTPAAESSAQAEARAERIAEAQVRLPVLRGEIARLTARGVGAGQASEAPAEAPAPDPAAQLERQWQEAVAAGRERFPTGRPAARPGLTFAEANAEVEQHVAVARAEARRAYWNPHDADGVATYAAYHAELARSQAWDMVLDDVGIGRPEPDAGASPGQTPTVESREALVVRLLETERVLEGLLTEAPPSPLSGHWSAWLERMRLTDARLRRARADIDLFTNPLPDDLTALERERQRLENIPGLLELPFAGPMPEDFRKDRVQLSQNRLAEVRAKIAAVQPQLVQEHAAAVRQLEQERLRLEGILEREQDRLRLAQLPFSGLPNEVHQDRIAMVRSRLRRLQADLDDLARWTPGAPMGPAFATAQRLRQAQLARAAKVVTLLSDDAVPQEVTWLRASRDTIPHLRAAAAAPRATGFMTLVAHTDGGAVLDGDTPLSAEQVAVRLGLPVVKDGPDGAAPVPSQDPATVVMLVCNAAGGLVPSGVSGDQGRPGTDPSASTPAGGLHNLTGQRIVAPHGEAIMLQTGEVIAGTWKAGNPDPVPVASGDWVVWENGVPRSLGTPFLREALVSLGAELLPTGTPPSAPVGFYNGLTPAQIAALGAERYDVPAMRAVADSADGAVGPDPAYSFYRALIAVAGDRLRGIEGPRTPEQVHRMVVTEFARDIRQPNSRYLDLIAGFWTPEQALAELATPARWGRQAAHLAPYVAADLFGIELGVLGPAGAILPVTDVTGPRVRDQHGRPFLLVRVGDRHFVPAVPLLAASPPGRAAIPARDLNPWTAELRRGRYAPGRPARQHCPVAAGRGRACRHRPGGGDGFLAQALRQMEDVPGEAQDGVRDDIRRLLARPGRRTRLRKRSGRSFSAGSKRWRGSIRRWMPSSHATANCTRSTCRRWSGRSPAGTRRHAPTVSGTPEKPRTSGRWVSGPRSSEPPAMLPQPGATLPQPERCDSRMTPTTCGWR